MIFVKYFTLPFLVKYFTSFYPQSFSQRKIFYNFDYILHAIKHLKMGKYFTKNILHRNKQSNNDKEFNHAIGESYERTKFGLSGRFKGGDGMSHEVSVTLSKFREKFFKFFLYFFV